jgi:hypothetical protein
VDTEQKLKIKHLLIEYQDIFMGPDGKLGHIDLLQHVIDTGNAKPVKQPPSEGEDMHLFWLIH